ncbi:MauE/DoxX family redox-associated membrane protein [Pedobacter sp. GR22-6]|uniref:MauE/DoxX family redox-associated membrane protein n=1 Tax=Pedobacter sp. GR22-6 TaxID=3127957 RepID=UPI00307F0D66
MNFVKLKHVKSPSTFERNVIVVDIICALFILLFIYTASDKLFKIHEFIGFMGKLEFMNVAPALFAWTIPVLEIIISLLLLFPRTQFKGLLASGIIMIAFTAYLIYMKMTAEHLPCHCGGAISKLTWVQHIWFNILLILIAGLGILLYRRKSMDT